MQFPEKILLATHNKGKVQEFQTLFDDMGVTVVGAGDIPEPEETETTFEGNALLKARHARQYTDLPCLADDSGLSVSALNGAPGVYSARWAGPSKDFNMAMGKVWSDIGDNPDKTASFIAVLALLMPDGSEHVVRGEIAGKLVYPPRGDDGFGYDSMFIPNGEDETFAEMGKIRKSLYSHRVKAFDSLKSKLNF